jgi:hypothetical protein
MGRINWIRMWIDEKRNEKRKTQINNSNNKNISKINTKKGYVIE